MTIHSYPLASSRLERSGLFVPASNWTMIQKAAHSSAAAVCLDLEDSVVISQKENARLNVIRAFQEIDFGERLRVFRPNGLDTPLAYRDLIEIVEAVGDRIDLIMVPKVNSGSDLHFVATLLNQIEDYRGFERRIGLEALIETAAGCLNIREIAQSTPRLETLIFGPGDFAASVRMPLDSIGEADENDRLYPGHRWHYIMQTLVVTGRAFGLRCLDGPFAGIHDQPSYLKACRIARAMGFDGKYCIHPGQLAVTNEVFSPSQRELDWAWNVVRACEQAVLENNGAVQVNGKMIDAASLRLAHNLTAQAGLA
jgi:citrate lyase beta subunit